MMMATVDAKDFRYDTKISGNWPYGWTVRVLYRHPRRHTEHAVYSDSGRWHLTYRGALAAQDRSLTAAERLVDRMIGMGPDE